MSLVAAYDGPVEEIYGAEGLIGRSDGLERRAARTRVMFLYLGSSGALGQFTRQLLGTVGSLERFEAALAVAGSGRATPSLHGLTDALMEVPGCNSSSPLSVFANFRRARRAFLQRVAQVRPSAVVTLMPHIWTPLLATAVRKIGVRYVSIAHDAVAHPGDPTAVLTPWLLRETGSADLVVTLSRCVADRLVRDGRVGAGRVVPLFHPDLTHGAARVRQRERGAPFRILFFGRVLPYKGLPLLVSAVEQLRAQGVDVRLGVVGWGSLGKMRDRLAAMGAEVINRWVEDDEVGPLLARYDAIALSHVEASQSGVAAMAFGHCMPVVGTPVGGLVEQIVDGRTGILARETSAAALADGIRRLAADPALYGAISANLKATASGRSMARFADALMMEISRRFA